MKDMIEYVAARERTIHWVAQALLVLLFLGDFLLRRAAGVGAADPGLYAAAHHAVLLLMAPLAALLLAPLARRL